ncbi:MAG: acyl-CoA dehydrogenase family protein [Clostridiaceae bacterium]
MSYLLSDLQKDFQAMVKDFALNQIRPAAKEADVTGEFPWEIYKKACDLGLNLIQLPEKFGGLGLDTWTYAIVKEEIAKGDAGLATTLGACALAFKPVSLAGNDYHMKMVADVITSGGLTAFGLTEANSGSDSSSLRTTATKVGDEYILNGSKCFITNAGIADLYTIFATVDKSKGARGITAFLVPKDTPGLSSGKHEDKLGIRTSNTADVILQDVKIPAKNMLGNEGQGFKIAMQTLDRTRPASGATACGVAQAALDYAVAYSKERETFGKPICKHQAVAFMLADMDIQLQAARAMTWHACRTIDAGVVDSKLFSSAKAFASDVAMKVTTDAVQILGGYGYSREYPVEKFMRDAKILQIFEGTNQIQRLIVSGHLLK